MSSPPVTLGTRDSRLACVVTKKQRRRQLAQASAQRRAGRQTARATRRRRFRLAAATLAVLVAVTSLLVWIVTRESDRESTANPGAVLGAPVVPTPHEVTR